MSKVVPVSEPLDVNCSHKLSSYEEAEALWLDILPKSTLNTLFTTPRWQKAWWDEFGNGSEMMLLSFETGDGVQGIAPLVLRDRVISFMGSQDLFDYSDFVISQGSEAYFFPCLLDHLADEQWDALELVSIHQDSSTLKYLPGLAKERGFSVDVREEGVSPVLNLPASWEDYVQALPKKARHELKRKFRRVDSAEGHFESYLASDPDKLENDLQDFFTLMRFAREPKHRFLTNSREQFFRTVSRAMSEIGVLKLFFMGYNSERVAGVMCFDDGPTRFMYNSGFHPDYSYYSVGLILKALCIKDAIESGKARFDFLRGDERYKYDLGGENRTLYQIVVRRK